ncbi:Uncharacterised protein [Burkholderia pseudomallei]|nr:Uncharacterised protein [Burkholderia pseudomallei]
MIGAFKDRLTVLLAQTQQQALQRAAQAAMQQPGAVLAASAMQPPIAPRPAAPAPAAMPAPMPLGASPR